MILPSFFLTNGIWEQIEKYPYWTENYNDEENTEYPRFTLPSLETNRIFKDGLEIIRLKFNLMYNPHYTELIIQ